MAMPIPHGRHPQFVHKSDQDFLESRNDGPEDEDMQDHPAFEDELDDDVTPGEPGKVTEGASNAEADPDGE